MKKTTLAAATLLTVLSVATNISFAGDNTALEKMEQQQQEQQQEQKQQQQE